MAVALIFAELYTRDILFSQDILRESKNDPFGIWPI